MFQNYCTLLFIATYTRLGDNSVNFSFKTHVNYKSYPYTIHLTFPN